MSKFNQKKENYIKAVKRLNEVNIKYKKNKEDDIIRDALTQRFEFTFELSWKMLCEWLIDEGVQFFTSSPKSVLKAVFAAGIISNEELWLNMLESRNSLAHIYNEEMSKSMADKISSVFCKELTELTKINL